MNNLGHLVNITIYRIDPQSPVNKSWQHITKVGVERFTGIKGLRLITLYKDYWHLQAYDSREEE